MITYKGKTEDLLNFLKSLPFQLSGQAPSGESVAKQLQIRLGIALLSKIQQDFITKSEGGTGEDGIKWKPLSPVTIANRRRSAKDKKLLTIKSRIARLSADEKKRFRKEYNRKRLEFIDKGYKADKAAELAKRVTVAKFRREGVNVPTVFDIMAGRDVLILRDTGELFRSLSPGYENVPSGADGQIFEVPAGRVTVGTNKKPWHHHGGGNLPSRPYWPLRGGLPSSWWEYLLQVLQRGLIKALEQNLRG